MILLFMLVVFLLPARAEQTSDAATPSVRGKIIFAGAAVPATTHAMNADPFCASLGPRSDPQDDVIVYARPLNPGPPTPPQGTVVLEFRDCRYVPHTVTMVAGQALIVRNSDPTVHNTHAWPKVSKAFNVALARPGSQTIQTFNQEEAPFPIRDDIHNWESANVGVFSHPYHMVSKLNGTYQFTLPPGLYELTVWHERLGIQTHMLQAKPGLIQEMNFVIQ